MSMNSRYGTERRAADRTALSERTDDRGRQRRMKLVKAFFGWTRENDLDHVWPLIFYLLAYLVWFHIIEIVPRAHYVQVILAVDRFIPFNEWFVIPYLSWFLFITIGIVYVYLTDRTCFDELATSLMTGMTVFLLISTFIPNRQPLRLYEMPRDNVLTRMVAAVWRSDTPTNVFPSIHVFNTTAVLVALSRTRRKRPIALPKFLGMTVWGLLIILSTVYIKQHSLFDVLTALALNLICWYAVDRRGRFFRFRRWDRWVEQRYRERDSEVGG